ncbi:hypothetical protein [Synechococcus sp. Cruz CV12-2-Slac-r]|uniref:hypothetical protein n=1 Tax=Synechococcus sp. Cruz CV12-2-Slac-r TaxID=2823748 RepID=UPI0020CF042E|nr:hypothetical protein [Synechococcus sp. Cruz CV12-2-Slac-r]MCP9940746.1 hypothetical protein [Synechococcus sp. Cruz CV12-2-Slac-r]
MTYNSLRRHAVHVLKKNMIKAIVASLLILATLPNQANAGGMSYTKKIQMCGVFAQANADGMSGKEMLRQMLVQRGDPGYLANVIYGEIKELCPRAY